MGHYAIVQRILGLLLMIFSLSMVPPLLVSLYYDDGSHMTFAAAFGITILTGFVVWSPVRRSSSELKLRDGFLVVVLFWLVLGSFGALPLLASEALDLSLTDAIFESMSGLTTTGATVIVGLDTLPKGILYYR